MRENKGLEVHPYIPNEGFFDDVRLLTIESTAREYL